MQASDFRQRQMNKMSEKSFGLQVEALAKTLGLRYYHTHRSQHSVAGFPDYVIISPKGNGVLYRELKIEGKNPTPEQELWLAMLAANGYDVGVWRPGDLLTDRIVNEMKGIVHESPGPGHRLP